MPPHGKCKLLDVGCGSGRFAHRMRLRGWDVTGLDFSEHAVRTARELFGLTVHHGSLPHPAILPASFDVINLGSVLEHLHTPHEVLDGAVSALRPGGYVAVTVPNFASWTLRHFGRHCYHLDLPRHLLHFTPATLRRMLDMHGLEVRSLRMLARVSWMRRTLEAVCAAADSTCKQRWLARLGKLPILRSHLTRWTARRGEADGMLALAYKPSLGRQVEETLVERVREERREPVATR